MSVNITVRVPRRLAEEMRKHREINWSEVVRRSIEDYLKRLDEARRLEAPGELLERLQELGVTEEDLEPLPPSVEEEYYKRMVSREWKRVSSTIQAQ